MYYAFKNVCVLCVCVCVWCVCVCVCGVCVCVLCVCVCVCVHLDRTFRTQKRESTQTASLFHSTNDCGTKLAVKHAHMQELKKSISFGQMTYF